MYEIELKAWLDDRQKVTDILSSIASYDGFHDKSDVYWSSFPDGKEGRRVTIRIRTETITKKTESQKTEILVTYKKHTKNMTPSGEMYEVNEEREFQLPSPDAADTFQTFLQDAGFQVSLQKHKAVEGWYKDQYHIELCSIDGLGDFIEIETIAEDDSNATVQTQREGLLHMLDLCEVPRNRIETKFYRELIEERSAGQKRAE